MTIFADVESRPLVVHPRIRWMDQQQARANVHALPLPATDATLIYASNDDITDVIELQQLNDIFNNQLPFSLRFSGWRRATLNIKFS